MANFSRTGFGQVEPNHLSAQRTAQIYAQLPATPATSVLENGQFVKYDAADGYVVADSTDSNYPNAVDGEWMMVFNEVKLYDDWRETYKDFAMVTDNYTEDFYYANKAAVASGTKSYLNTHGLKLNGQMVPRVIKTNIGDIYTTNCIGAGNTTGSIKIDCNLEVAAGNTLCPNKTTGYLVLQGNANADTSMKWKVIKVTTMPDGQDAVKLMRIA